jgi:serine/threonine-protein kinase HipA
MQTEMLMARRIKRVTVAEVWLHNRRVGAVAWNDERQNAEFEYDDSFISNHVEVAPLTMPLRKGIYSFPALSRATYRGLPGLLADSLPDRFGNALIDVWLQQRGRTPEDFTPIERLCYVGSRGMGALEFKPALTHETKSVPLEIDELTTLAREILTKRAAFIAKLTEDPSAALTQIIRVGTSAGGARAKAVIAWNPQTGEVRSGQVSPPAGFESWLLKFDGVNDRELGDPEGFGRVEYAYHRMATAAGITMSKCRLLEEGGRAHFMTRRFDRDDAGDKIHVQSLCALMHYDFNLPGAYSYEQAAAVINRLNLGHEMQLELFRRAVFNIVARNQDDHTRNIAFTMDRSGRWSLAPAFDIIWAYRPDGQWTSRHQMRLNGKQDDFTREDLRNSSRQFGIKDPDATVNRIVETVSRWPSIAREAGVPGGMAERIGKTHRLHLGG